MLAFVDSHRRDFQPSFDVTVKGMEHKLNGDGKSDRSQSADIPDQEKMTLGATIKYKSNNHISGLKGMSCFPGLDRVLRLN